ncbi:MAG TPA: WecB/TagA/CpsF family glycosyltransferase [Pirellulaceae bacterium]|jgi:N-acetylglucosaminyldiphosphoundecaprenol N-acetyl-beta-D-mannosaminyltransferase|nr:WecB/TagA/CpsF family glycosyltransferase [Pirellulaceae bacterium]
MKTIQLFGMKIDSLRMSEAVERVRSWIDEPFERMRYVVTPNLDHAVLFQDRADLRAAYADASLTIADGQPLIWASRLLRKPLPERVAGSDLVPRLFDDADRRGRELTVFLLGAAPGVGARAADAIAKRWKHVRVVGVESPPLGFDKSEAETERLLAAIEQAAPDLLLVGLGAPKQELWIHRHRERIHARAALGIGAVIDFLAGERQRAPVWMQRCGIEWLHRISQEPKRLGKRYAYDAWRFPQLLLREAFSRKAKETDAATDPEVAYRVAATASRRSAV